MSTSGPAHRVVSAVEQYGFPNGHIGHLTPEEEETLKIFKQYCEEKGFYKPGDGADEYGTHDDATLLRFLRARRFNVEDAFAQFKDTEEWRAANQLDVLYETIELKPYDETRMLYPQWTGRRDKRGMPIYVFEIKHLNSRKMAEYEKSAAKFETLAKTDGKTNSKLLRLFALYENLIRFVLPLCTALTDRDHPNTPITQSSNIVDVSGVSLKMFWNLKNHMQDASTLATAHYPETLDRIFIIGAPAFFSIVWGWIKRWFDPITTSKIFIVSHSELKTTLHKFIDPANIPKKYGGELDYEFGQPPVLDPALKDVLKWAGNQTDFPQGPMYWKEKRGHIELTAVGYEDGKPRHEVIASIDMTKDIHNLDEKMDGVPLTPAVSRGNALLTVPGAAPPAPEPIHDIPISADNQAANGVTLTPEIHIDGVKGPVVGPESNVVVQAGELVPETRPEPVTFVTAKEGLADLTLNENAVQVNGATTVLADKLEQTHQDSRVNSAALRHSFEDNIREQQVAQVAH